MDNHYLEPEIEDLFNFLNSSGEAGENILTPKKVDENFDKVGRYLNYLLVYPDRFLDIATPAVGGFSLHFYQRVMLRSGARHRQSFIVATRGASKSFCGTSNSYFSAMCLPGHKSFISADVKSQATRIAREKIVDDIWVRYPILRNEMVKIPQPGKAPQVPFQLDSDSAEFRFTGGGRLDVLGVDSARGARRHSGSLEEVIEFDGTDLNEKVIPTMNIARTSLSGKVLENEPHAAKRFITTAGFKDHYSYEKFLETLCLTALDPANYMVVSMTYKTPMRVNMISEQTIRELMASPSFNRESFLREYCSVWSGAMKGAVFSGKSIKRTRKIVRAETRPYINQDEDSFYILAADMAKDGSANTVVVVIKVVPQEFAFSYRVVNDVQIDSSDYKIVSDQLKSMAYVYNPRLLVYDANGIGASLRDWINRDSVSEVGEVLPGLGIINPPSTSEKYLIKYPKDRTIVYEIKTGGNKGSEVNKLFLGRVTSGAVRLLITAKEALNKFKQNKNFINSTQAQQKEALRPYQMCDRLEEELLNLDVVEVKDGGNTGLRVKRRNQQIEKDHFSALSYGIYATHVEIELKHYKRKGKKKRKLSNIIRLD